MAFQVKIIGNDKLKKAIEKKQKDLVNGVGRVMDAELIKINNEQKNLAPVDTGGLRQATQFNSINTLNKELVSAKEYAPYVEFGTGDFVSVPTVEGLAEYAIQFKGKGIRKVNIAPKPYFFAPFFRGSKKMIANILKLLDK